MNWLLLLLAADAALVSLGFSLGVGIALGYRVGTSWRSRKGRRRAPYLNPPRQVPMAAAVPGGLGAREFPGPYRPGRCPAAPAGLAQTAVFPRVGDGPGPTPDPVRRPFPGHFPPSLPLTSPQRRPGSRL